MPEYRIIYSQDTERKISTYGAALRSGEPAGAYVADLLSKGQITDSLFVSALLQSKRPQIFAESAVLGDGSDWNARELSILGDIAMAMEVTVYDNALHASPQVHATPFAAELIFIPGALLRNDHGKIPADWLEVTQFDELNLQAYCELYERRLLPLFRYIHQRAEQNGRRAVVTIPGLGCGQFSGPFVGKLAKHLAQCIAGILQDRSRELQQIALVYFDPYQHASNHQENFGSLTYRVRPFTQGNDLPQLCLPQVYAEDHEDLSQCDLYSLVAWDPVSWPGNDFYLGARMTDDGVKAAATDVMFRITGIEGQYDARTFRYTPPGEYENWLGVVNTNKVQLVLSDNVLIY